MNAAELISFEREVAAAIDIGRVPGPTHLSGGNEDQLIDVFKAIRPHWDWCLSTWRSHYHALLHGVPRELVMERVLSGRSMNLAFDEYRFLTSAIVGGMLSIGVGIAAGLKRWGTERRVWIFCGDMGAMTGAFHEAHSYALGHSLPVTFVVEDNGLSTDTPTRECWRTPFLYETSPLVIRYRYERTWPHIGTKPRSSL